MSTLTRPVRPASRRRSDSPAHWIVHTLFSGLLSVGLLLAAPQTASAQASGAASGDLLPAKTYYVVTRIDPRMCPTPLCGGVYVKQVNRMLTRCADGKLEQDCYAPILDWSALGLSDSEVRRLEDDFRARRLVARAELRIVASPYGPLASLVVSDAWRGVTGHTPASLVFGLQPSGIVCITYPCPVLDAVRLNQSKRRRIHGVDLAASGADAAQIEAGLGALYQGPGLLVAGARMRIRGPAGLGIELVASEFYTKVPSGSGGSCNDPAPLPPPGDFCPMIWDPVCGCNGITYSNECVLQNAQVRLAHVGECSVP